MDTLRSLFKSTQRPIPARVESDDVYPVHMLDDSKTLRGIVVTWTMCFDDVLDAEVLRTGLERLLDMEGWRKVGGRVRMSKTGTLEIHVPRPFTPQRRSVSYTHAAHSIPLSSHALGAQIPRPQSRPSIHPGPPVFRAFAAPEDAPETLDDYLYADRPQLGLHVTSFTDATLVAVSWPHTLMDVMGLQAVLRGWSMILAGRDDDVPVVLGAREDAMRTALQAVEKPEPYALSAKRLQGWAMAKFGMRFAGDLLWNRVVETRTVCLPKEAIAALTRMAKEGLAEDVFVSEGDVLTAWTLRAVAASMATPRPVAALHALNARFRLKKLVGADGVYVQNMATAAFAVVPADVATGPLGPIALENRRQLAEQATEAQVMAYLGEMDRDKADPATMLYCDSDALLMPYTNWSRADLYKTVDFGPAVLRAGETGEKRNAPGTMVFHHAQSMRQTPTARNVVVILGKDLEENRWLIGTLLPATWAKIELEMDSLV